MNFLAIDSSTELSSVALLTQDGIFYKKDLDFNNRSKFILKMIDSLLIDSGICFNKLDAIIYCAGPGSFTGIRVTCSIVKGLAYTMNIPLFSVSSFNSIAQEVYSMQRYIGINCFKFNLLVLIDAKMNRVYWDYIKYKFIGTKERISNISSISIPEDKSKLILAGVFNDKIISYLSNTIKSRIVNKFFIYPNAKSIISFILNRKILVKNINVIDVIPTYLKDLVL
ncbi:tRNA (adenosine(37)-N6)-threonylcarbamoyltransferase complex dimerization subunit type 1 TsaB [Candidatus Legionella polyplacis]|uniref:tRNA (adenosine(37)-N6)-threonylcarbamoyltransferase complex dimerization subunit type 1 TsaB n=1 Tax=Candidatus Legionella polyplacis TaxID=2005262 RepID=UPI000C1E9A50|nr:tRNA (adenosine(37)-N6)-threonylcarbamoyltransferase complex dimerization subunit type 1 TsaB [Candidatus Legionella polyplacis]ATW01813.1 tRNA (adenosine(37)-N6)-threonylcarbamoyltransferase complex dimerization subunit type 1 TsaB [Candidatus Legionella polyplacis]